MNHTRLLLLATLSSLLLALWPQSTLAACDALNIGACVDAASYGVFHGIAATIWSLDRALLVLAYQIDQIHWWLTTQAFLSAYTALRLVAEPLLAPMATLAVIIGLLLFLLVPIVGRIALINIRQVFIWIVIAPLILAQAGTWLLTLEETRADIGMVLTGQVSGIAAQGLFGPPNDDPTEALPPPTPLYPEAGQPSPCANAPVNRPARVGTVAPAGGVRTDDLAATLLLADAQDIHCPAARGPDRDLPDRFYDANGFAVNAADLSSNPDAVQRAAAIAKIQRGITRLSLGIVACILAVLDALIQCMFSLSLIVIWLAIPIVVVCILFSSSLRPLGMLLQRGMGVMITSWVVGLLLGLLTACLSGAAATGNPTAVIGITLGGVLFAARLLLVAVTTFTESLSGMGALLGGAAGIAVMGGVSSIGNLTQRAVRAAGGLVAGGVGGAVGAAVTGGMAYRASGSARYALGAAAGTIRPIAQVGAVAASMGLVREDTAAGLYAGERSGRSGLGAFARQMQSDQQRKLSDGTTISLRARKRGLERQLQQAARPTMLQRAEGAFDYVGSGAMADDLSGAGDALIGGVQSARSHAAQGAARVGHGIATTAQTATNPERVGDIAAAAVAGTVGALRRRDAARRPEARAGMAQRMGAHGKLEYLTATPPADALLVAPSAIRDPAGLLAAGYTMQNQPDGQMALWDERANATDAAGKDRRAALVQAGLLIAASANPPTAPAPAAPRSVAPSHQATAPAAPTNATPTNGMPTNDRIAPLRTPAPVPATVFTAAPQPAPTAAPAAVVPSSSPTPARTDGTTAAAEAGAGPPSTTALSSIPATIAARAGTAESVPPTILSIPVTPVRVAEAMAVSNPATTAPVSASLAGSTSEQPVLAHALAQPAAHKLVQTVAPPPDMLPDTVIPAPTRLTRRQRQRHVIETTADTEVTHNVQPGTMTTQLPLPAPMGSTPTGSTSGPAAATPIAANSPAAAARPPARRGASAVVRDPAAPSTTTPPTRRRSRS